VQKFKTSALLSSKFKRWHKFQTKARLPYLKLARIRHIPK